MLTVLLVWVLTWLCLLGLGWGVLRLLGCSAATHPFILIVAGLAAATTLGHGWAYFLPVAPGLYPVLLAISLLILLLDRHRWSNYRRRWWTHARATPWWQLLPLIAIVGVALMLSAAPFVMPDHIDQGGYFLPTIRWIEQYPLVPGIANIERRLGFNSAFHMASAVFGQAWLIPGGAYTLNGLLLVVFSSWCLGALRPLVRTHHPVRLSHLLKLFSLFFLMRSAIPTAAPDLSNMILSETVLILFIQRIEQQRVTRADGGFLLLLLLTLFTLSIKLSSAPLLLIPLYLGIRILATGNSIHWGRLVALGAVVILPWMGRFLVLTGYLVYPLYQLDVLHVDWKVPEKQVREEYFYVREFAKTNARPEESETLSRERSLREWVPLWYARENALNRATAWLVGIGLLGMLVAGIARLRSIRTRPDPFALGGILLVSVLFWFVNFPAFRFGWAWCIAVLALCVHGLTRWPWGRTLVRIGTLAVLFLTLATATLRTAKEQAPGLATRLVTPAPTPVAATTTIQLGPIPAQAAETILCWGCPPPCLPKGYPTGLEARGNSVQEGFREKGKAESWNRKKE